MRMIFATVGLVTFLSSNAFAQEQCEGTILSNGMWSAPGQAYALPVSYRRTHRGARNVYDTSGFYVGRDPDRDVRFQLRRDPETGVTRSTRMRRR
jgi:hypothetical protein